MDIKEFYITDKDAGSDGFWSEDKINKLNENFNRLSAGLTQGQPGYAGGLGISGADGATGDTGADGADGDTGAAGINGLNIWERVAYSFKSKVKQRLDNSCIIVGLGNTSNSIVQTSTFVEGGGTIKPSALRVHALNKHNTGTQRNHIHLKSGDYTSDINFREYSDSKVLNGYFDVYGSELGTERSPNMLSSSNTDIIGWEEFLASPQQTANYQVAGVTESVPYGMGVKDYGTSQEFWFKSTNEISGLEADKTYVITGEVLVSTQYVGTADIYLTTDSEFGTYEDYTVADLSITGYGGSSWQKLTTYFTTDTDVAGRVYGRCATDIINGDWLHFRNISIRDLQWHVPEYSGGTSNAVIEVEDGALKITKTGTGSYLKGFARQSISYTDGKDYEVKFSLKNGNTTITPTIYVKSQFDDTTTATTIATITTLSGDWVDYTYTFTATAASVDISIGNGAWNIAGAVGEYFYIDNVSVKEVESPTATIASQHIAIKSSNININESMYLTDNGIVLDPDTSATVNGAVNFGSIASSVVVNVDIIGDVTIPTVAGTTITGHAIKSTAGFTSARVDTSISFFNISDSYNSFPYGSIISISTKEYDENFENDYTDDLTNTGPNTQNGQGYESIHGRGTGSYAGWYLCNGMAWQDIHVTGSPAFFTQIVPKLNTTNYNINGVNLPSSTDYSDYTVTGAQLNIAAASSDITISETSSVLEHNIGQGTGGGSNILYHDDSYNINNKIFVIWLGTEYSLYWYTQPFSNQDEVEVG